MANRCLGDIQRVRYGDSFRGRPAVDHGESPSIGHHEKSFISHKDFAELPANDHGASWTTKSISHAMNESLVEAHKLTTSREMLLWMAPSEAPKALQASECSELLDPMRASCWISAQH